MFSYVSVCPQCGRSHVTITHDALDLTVQEPPPPAPIRTIGSNGWYPSYWNIFLLPNSREGNVFRSTCLFTGREGFAYRGVCQLGGSAYYGVLPTRGVYLMETFSNSVILWWQLQWSLSILLEYFLVLRYFLPQLIIGSMFVSRRSLSKQYILPSRQFPDDSIQTPVCHLYLDLSVVYPSYEPELSIFKQILSLCVKEGTCVFSVMNINGMKFLMHHSNYCGNGLFYVISEIIQYKLLYTISNNIEVYEEPVSWTNKIIHRAGE